MMMAGQGQNFGARNVAPNQFLQSPTPPSQSPAGLSSRYLPTFSIKKVIYEASVLCNKMSAVKVLAIFI